MNTLIPGAPLRSLSPTSIEYQRAQGASRAAKPARAARFTLDAPEHSGTIPGAIGDILPPGVALTSNLAVIFTLNQYSRGRRHKRRALLEATCKELEKVCRMVERRRLHGKEDIRATVKKLLNKYKVGKYYRLDIRDDGFDFELDETTMAADASRLANGNSEPRQQTAPAVEATHGDDR